MRVFRYSRWDGSQSEFSLDAKEALDALSDLMMEGLSAEEALEWMRQYGFQLGGLDMAVMGLDELMQELRDQIEELYEKFRLDQAQEEPQRKLDDILDREESAVREQHGIESARVNDFLSRRHAEDTRLSDRIERFRNYEFEDEETSRTVGRRSEKIVFYQVDAQLIDLESNIVVWAGQHKIKKYIERPPLGL